MTAMPPPDSDASSSADIEAVFNLDNIPRDYLEAYPFPAFVLLLRCPPEHTQCSSDTAPHPLMQPWTLIEPLTLTEPFRPVWFNSQWSQVAGTRPLLDCITLDAARRLGDWVTGASGPSVRRRLAESYTQFRDEIAAEAKSRELSEPLAQRLTSRRGSTPYGREGKGEYAPLGASALQDDDPCGGGVGTITVEFAFPRDKAMLELVMTSIPLFKHNGLKCTTNSLAVITAIPRSNLDLCRGGLGASVPPLPPLGNGDGGGDGPGLEDDDYAERRDACARDPLDGDKLFNGRRMTHNWVSGNSIHIKQDGSLYPPVPPVETVHPSGRPLDVRRLIWKMDWAQTPLGPMDQWPATLRMILRLCLGFPLQVCVWWGRDLTMFYNEAFAQGFSKHPMAYGTSGAEAYSELWSGLGSLTELLLSGTSIYKDDFLHLYHDVATGRTYETYKSGLWSAFMNDQSEFGGIWHALRDSTAAVVGDRRTKLLADLGDRTSAGRTTHDFKTGVLETLHAHPKDCPFALLYFTDNTGERSPSGSVRLRYAGGVGIPESHPSAPEVVDSANAPWPFEEALKTRRPVVVDDISALLEGYEVRVWDELPYSAVVLPIALQGESGCPGAVLVLGISSRLSYDAAYQAFIEELGFRMASYLSVVRLYNADQQRIEDLASLDKAKSTLFLNVSHELFTPIGLISGPLDDLMASVTDGHKHSLLQTARRNTRRLARLVEMITDLSRLEAGRLQGSFRKENLGVVTSGVAGLFHKPAAKGKLEYTIECDQTQMETFVDRELWEKILFVLIGATIKHAKRFATVKLTYSTHFAMLTIANCERAGHVELDSTNLSLAFATKLVELHRGNLIFRSGDDGCIYDVHIPLGSSHLAADAIAAPATQPRVTHFTHEAIDDLRLWESRSVSSNSADTPKSPDGMYFTADDVIMVVDDVSDSRRYITSILEPFCTVVEAMDGQDALQKFSQYHPNLIIAECVMPRLNGPGLVAELRAGSKEQQQVPVIILTAAGATHDEQALVADDTLTKPFNARELIARAHMQMQLGKKRRALEQLFDERAMELQLVTEGSPVGMFRCDGVGQMVYANPAWFALSGYPVEEQGKFSASWGDYLTEDSLHRCAEMWHTWIPSKEQSYEIECQYKNGRWSVIKLLRLDKKVQPGFIGCVVDITERKLNEELQRQRVEEAEMRRAEAEEARHQQELLIDITSHEIRNPISSQFALDKVFKPTQQLLSSLDEDLEALDSIYQCGLAQERISNDVLSLGKMQLDLLQMFDVETDIRREVQKITSIFQNEARMNRISLQLAVSPVFDTLGIDTVMTDPVRLGQVVTNLLSNATRFTANSRERQIRLHLDAGLEPPLEDTCVKPVPVARPPTLTEGMPIYIYVAVSDTGPGLTPSDLENLFQRFAQASPMTHTVFGGSGLGLFVCRKIVELMGGRIEVTSRYGHGSEFRFFITCKVGKLLQRPQAPAMPQTPEMPRTPPLPKVASKPRILVVEDNLINRTVLVRQLNHVGLEADSASNGQEGLDKIRESRASMPFDCILMDLEMPIMDGYTAVRHVRDDETSSKGVIARSNVIALTGNARQALIKTAMADFDDVVVKPYRLDSLLHTIESVLGRCRKPLSEDKVTC